MKSKKIDRIAMEFKEFLHETIDNVFAEAVDQELSQEAIYKWRSPDSMNHMPAYAVIASRYGDVIIDYLKRRRAEFNIDRYAYNGSVDDEWALLSVLFSVVRGKFLKGEYYDAYLAQELKVTLERLMAEWLIKSEKSDKGGARCCI